MLVQAVLAWRPLPGRINHQRTKGDMYTMKRDNIFRNSESNRGNMRATLFLIAALSAGACEPEYLQEATIGTAHEAVELGLGNPLDFVNAYEERKGVSVDFVAFYKRRVGTIAQTDFPGLHDKLCSGTLVGKNLFLTAGHCIKDNIEEMYVAFNYELEDVEGSPQFDEEFYPIEEVVDYQYRFDIIDYMLLRLSGDPGDEYGVTPMAPVQEEIDDVDVALGETIVIIGHPMEHAKAGFAGRKQVSVGEITDIYYTFEDMAEDQANGRLPTIIQNRWDLQGYNQIRYNADTRNHSSGSGVLDTSGVLVGVHVAGSRFEQYNNAMSMQHIYRHSDAVRAVANGTLQ